MSIGPIEYMIVAFPGNQFKGEIAPALAELVESKTIRIIDLAFVIKDSDGNVVAMEASDVDSEVGKAFASLEAEMGGLLNEDDIAATADELEPNSSAALLVWEDLWAAKLADAIRNAGGELYDLERVPHDIATAAVEWAEANS